MSLAQLSEWCSDRFGRHPVARELTPRLFDIPWVVMDAGLAQETWKWEPASPLSSILDEIAQHAEQNPAWLEISAAL
jgi:CDP-paratose 2-epimerase